MIILLLFVVHMAVQIGVCGLIVGYTIIGAFMFIALEADAVQPMTQEVISRRRSCVDYLWNS